MEKLPPLRQDVDILPVRHDGKEFLVVRDSLGLVAEGLALRAEIAPLLSRFDGRHSLQDLQQALAGKGGPTVPVAEIKDLVAQLDALGLLQTERYFEARRQAVEVFQRSPVREAALAGSAYPAEKKDLAPLIDNILATAGDAPGRDSAPVALVAPHIDLGVSEKAYGAAYGALRGSRPSSVLLLGTGHALDRPFCLTDKTFRTPLGDVATDREACRDLAAVGGGALAAHDFVHRSEHSLEFQLLFLQRLFPMEEVPVIPLLCGSFDRFLYENRDPLDDPDVRRFIEELRRWRGAPPEGKIVVAGVDFSHVGPKFGDAEGAREMEEEFRDYDGKLLQALAAGDREAFFELGVSTGNCYKVCGFSALWTLLALLPDARGTVLDYQVWHEEATKSAVSFAAVAFSPDRP